MIKQIYKFWTIICVSFILQGTYADCPKFKLLFNLMQKRALLLKDVAANKYYFLPLQSVYDADQEIKVLNNVADIADKLHLNKYNLMCFAQIQMDMSKQIEQYWINIWINTPNLAPKKNNYLDLAAIRQKIKSIDSELYPALKQAIQDKQFCTPNEIESEFNDGFSSKIIGIPLKPNLNKLLLNTVLTVN